MLTLKNCSIGKFVSYANGKRVYAFGAGQYVVQFCEENKEYGLDDIISFFTDNNPQKYGTNHTINERKIQIIPIDDFLNSVKKDDIILITSADYFHKITEQLDSTEALDGIDCFILVYVINYAAETDMSGLKAKIDAAKEKEQQIPKKIHYIWFGGNDIPDNLKKDMESWYKFCPDYEIIRWDENNYDVGKSKFTRSAYKAKKWSKVSNYARMDIVYENGGIYLDNDIEVLKPLDGLLYHQAFMSFSGFDTIELGNGFGARKNYDLLRLFLDEFESKPYSDEHHNNHIYKRGIFKSLGFKLNNTFQYNNGLVFYSNNFFAPMNPRTGAFRITDQAYSHHKFFAMGREDVIGQRNDKCNFYKIFLSRVTCI